MIGDYVDNSTLVEQADGTLTTAKGEKIAIKLDANRSSAEVTKLWALIGVPSSHFKSSRSVIFQALAASPSVMPYTPTPTPVQKDQDNTTPTNTPEGQNPDAPATYTYNLATSAFPTNWNVHDYEKDKRKCFSHVCLKHITYPPFFVKLL